MHVLSDFAKFFLNFHTLLNLFWTNLLTQCTQLPVAVFCCFCISGFPAIKSAPKIPEKSDKKSALRKLHEKPREGRGATTRRPEGSLTRPHPRPRQGASWLTGGSPWCPLRLYLPLAEETPKMKPFFPISPLYRRRRRFKIGASWRSCSVTLPEGGTPSGRPYIDMDASQMCRE